jgi:hypothetical protein
MVPLPLFKSVRRVLALGAHSDDFEKKPSRRRFRGDDKIVQVPFAKTRLRKAPFIAAIDRILKVIRTVRSA